MMEIRVDGRSSVSDQKGDPFFQTIIESLPCSVVMTDRYGIITYCNRSLLRITGWSKNDVIGKMRCDQSLGVPRPDPRMRGSESLQDGVPASLENRLLDMHGSEHRIRWTSMEIRGDDGAVAGLACIGEALPARASSDITTEHDIREIIENLHDAVILYDLNGDILEVNNLMLEMFRIDRDALRLYTVEDLFSNFSDDVFRRICDDVMSNSIQVFEWKARNPVSGREFDVEVDLRTFELMGDDIILGSIRDISKRKKIENDLKESEEKFKSIFEKSALPQLLIEDGKFIDCNRKILDLLGFQSKEMILGLTPADISPGLQPDGMPSADKAKQLLADAVREPCVFEWVHHRQNGEELYLIVMLTPIIIQGKNILHTAWINITRRKHAEMTLLESEIKYKSIFEGTNDAIMLLREGRFIDCNMRALEMFGYTDKECLNSVHPSDISPPVQPSGGNSSEAAEAHIRTALQTGNDRFEWMHRRANGELFPAEVVLSSFDLRGTQVLQATVRDITERKKAEQSLRDNEERYRLLSDVTFEGILMHEDGIAYDVNLAFCNLHGYTREEVLGINVIDLVILEEYRPLAYEKASSQVTEPYELLSRRKDGTLIWLEVMGKPYVYNGKTIRVVAMRDITQRRLAEEALKISEDKFRRVTESSLDIMITANSKRVIQFISHSITRYTGYRQVELLGMNFESFLPESEVQKNLDYIQEALDGKAIGLYETSFIKKDGTLACMEMSIVPVKSRKKTVELEFFARDVSDRKFMEQEIIRACEKEQQRIGQDLHDGLGQTLTGILLMLGTVARKVEMGRPVVRDEIMQIARRVREAIETTRQTARGLYSVTMEKGGLVSALREMADLVEADYGIRCAILHRGLSSLYDMRMSNQLYFIAREAVNNALRHSNVKKIVIEIVIDEKKLYMAVENDGGKKREKTAKSDGMGMKIMQYRANMIGALLNAQYTENGFRVELDVTHA